MLECVAMNNPGPEIERDAKLLVDLRVPARADQLKRVRAAVRQAGREAGCREESIGLLVLAVDEACANVIRHAYGVHQEGDMILQIYRSPLELTFRLIDFAEPVDRSRIRSRDLQDVRPGGLGVHLINEIMDNIEFRDPDVGHGNVLEMRKTLPMGD